MKTLKMTVRELRTKLFETNLFAVIGSEEMTNSEARRFLFEIENQDRVLGCIENGNHLLIWNL